MVREIIKNKLTYTLESGYVIKVDRGNIVLGKDIKEVIKVLKRLEE